jgi:hypothetical protein
MDEDLAGISTSNGVLDQVGRALVVTQVGDDGKPQKILSIGARA